MPTSRADAIPFVLELVQQWKPTSILDVGVGHGKWGALFREYLDVWDVASPYGDRRTRIDGVEVFESYRNPLWSAYTGVHVCDASLPETTAWLGSVRYDLLFLGDVLEHLGRAEALRLLAELDYERVIIVTPLQMVPQGAVYGNPHEEHVTQWTAADFPHLQPHIVGNQLVLFGTKEQTGTAKRRARIGVMATLWERRAQAQEAIASIAPQVDRLVVVLNRQSGEADAAPMAWMDALVQSTDPYHKRVSFVVSDNRLGDAERYRNVELADVIYLSCDDDLRYPPDYVEKMVAGVQRTGHAVTCHGKRFGRYPATSYFNDHYATYLSCRSPNYGDERVQVPGTGCMAWDGRQLDLRYARFAAKNRADLEVARIAAEDGVAITCVAHQPLEYLSPVGPTIFDVASKDEAPLVAALNAVLARTQRISVSMIVKNEAVLLERALLSVADADEIVVVDTGSTDGTIDIAKQHTPHVYHGPDFAWRDDFAFSRNQSLDRCTGEWILILDADEVLEPGGIAKCRAAIAEIGAFRSVSVNCVSERGGEVHRSIRLFRRDPDVRWHAPVHNYLSLAEQNPRDITITYGYSPAHQGDPDRALRILTKVLADNPLAVREAYYLAREHWYRNDYATAERWYRDYLTRATWGPEMADAWLLLARCLWHQQRGDEARVACLRAIGLNANFREAELFMAEMSGPGNARRWRQIAETATNEGILFVRGA